MHDLNTLINGLNTEDEKRYAERYYKWLNRANEIEVEYSVKIPDSITYPRAVEIQTGAWSVKNDQDNARSQPC